MYPKPSGTQTLRLRPLTSAQDYASISLSLSLLWSQCWDGRFVSVSRPQCLQRQGVDTLTLSPTLTQHTAHSAVGILSERVTFTSVLTTVSLSLPVSTWPHLDPVTLQSPYTPGQNASATPLVYSPQTQPMNAQPQSRPVSDLFKSDFCKKCFLSSECYTVVYGVVCAY